MHISIWIGLKEGTVKMFSSVRKKFAVLLAASACFLFCGFIGLDKTTGSAEDVSVGFYCADGASVRIGETSGIRFEAVITQEWYAKLLEDNEGYSVEFHSLLAPATEDISSLTPSTPNVKDNAFSFIPSFSDGGTYSYYTALVYDNLSEETEEVRMKAYATEISFRAYALLTKENYESVIVYATATDTTRSARAIANVALKNQAFSDEETAVLKSYLGESKVIGAENDFYYNISEGKNSVLDVAEIPDGIYEVYNGAVRVCDSSVENGKLTLVSGLNFIEGESYQIALFNDENDVYNLTLNGVRFEQPKVTATQEFGSNIISISGIKNYEEIIIDSASVEAGAVLTENGIDISKLIKGENTVSFSVYNKYDRDYISDVTVPVTVYSVYKSVDVNNFQYPTDRENYVVTETQYKTNIVCGDDTQSLYFEADKWGARLKTNGWDLRGIRKVQFAVYNYWQDYDLLHYFCESTSGVYLPIKKDTWNTVTFDVDAYKYAYPDSDLSNICSTLQFDAVEGTPIYISSIYLFRYDTFTSYGGGTYESISPEIFSYPVEEHYTANVHEISAAQKYDGDNTLLIKSGEANCWGIRFTTNAWDLSGINKLQFAVRNTWGAELLIKHEFCEAETTTITTNAATWTVITLDIAAYRAKHPDADMSNVNSAIEITGYTYTDTPIYFSDFYIVA